MAASDDVMLVIYYYYLTLLIKLHATDRNTNFNRQLPKAPVYLQASVQMPNICYSIMPEVGHEQNYVHLGIRLASQSS